MMQRRSIVILAVLVAAVLTTAAAVASTSIKAYVAPVGPEYEVKALFSVGDTVPWSGGSGQYRMVGIPDGLGAHPNGDGTTTLYMNSEFPAATLSEPLVGGAKNRGAIVSLWTLDSDGDPIAGRRAYDWVFQENTLVGPAPVVGNDTRPFSRFCSGGIAGPPHGFDRWIYLTNEEEGTRRTHSTAREGRRSRSSTTPSMRCRSWAASRGRTPSSSRTRASAR